MHFFFIMTCILAGSLSSFYIIGENVVDENIARTNDVVCAGDGELDAVLVSLASDISASPLLQICFRATLLPAFSLYF